MSSPALLVLVASPVVFFLWLLAMPGGNTVRLWVDDIALCLFAAAASFACFLAARRYGNTRMGRSWAVLSLGMLAMTFGEVAWGVQELGLQQEVNSPSVADIGYLAFYPIIFLGLFSMPQAPLSGLRRLKLALEIAICIGAVGLISFEFVIEALFSQNSGSWLADAITVTYPIGDLAIVFATLALAMRGRNRASMGMAVLALGFLSIAVSDSLFTYLTQVGDYYSGSLMDTGWILGYSLIAIAGLLASGRRLDIDAYKEDTDKPVPLWEALALQAVIVPVAAMLFLNEQGSTVSVDIFALAGFIVLVLLATVRHGITQHENIRLNHQLEQMTRDLQTRIQIDRLHSLSGPNGEPESKQEPAAPPSEPQAFVRPEFGEASSHYDPASSQAK